MRWTLSALTDRLRYNAHRVTISGISQRKGKECIESLLLKAPELLLRDDLVITLLNEISELPERFIWILGAVSPLSRGPAGSAKDVHARLVLCFSL